MILKELENILPPKIFEETKETAKGMGEKDKEKFFAKVLEVYNKSKFESGEAIGIIAAQSVSEPATQMSLPFEEKILIKSGDKLEPIEIGKFVDTTFEKFKSVEENGSEIVDIPENENIFVYSLDQNEKLQLKRIKAAIRHKAPKKLLQIKTASGRRIVATDHHSFVIRKENKIIPVSGKSLKAGDRIPAVKFLPEHCAAHLQISAVLPSVVKNGEKVFPYVAHSKSLPDMLPLDSGFGFFVGAYLSEGNATKSFTNISNTEENFNNEIRSFAGRFNFTINEYDNTRGFSLGHDVRVNSSLLSKLMKETCGSGSREKKIPAFAYSAREEFVSALLRGYFDGDGSITVERKGIRAGSESKELLDGIALLLARFGIFASKSNDGRALWISQKHAAAFLEKIGTTSKERKEMLEKIIQKYSKAKITAEQTDMIPGIGNILLELSRKLKLPTRYVNNYTKRQRVGRETLKKLAEKFERVAKEKKVSIEKDLEILRRAVDSDVVWDKIENVSYVDYQHEYVYDISVDGLETFTTFSGLITHNTMRTYHAAGAAAVQVTLGLPRLVEIFDARKAPSTPVMTIHLQKAYNTKEKAAKLASEIREVLLEDISTTGTIDLLNQQIEINIDTKSMRDAGVRESMIMDAVKEEFKGLSIQHRGDKIFVKPKSELTVKEMQKLKSKVLDCHIKGVKSISNAVVTQKDDEWIITTVGSNLAKVLDVQGIDSGRTTTNNIHEVERVLGIEAARATIINEAMNTLKEQGLDVDVRHVMLTADVMTVDGTIKAIGRYGVAGLKGSVLARANFEETIKHLTKAAATSEIDNLDSIVENVMINQVVPVGTGMFDLTFKMPGKKKSE